MNDIILNYPNILYLLLISPLIIALVVRALIKQNKATIEFDSTGKRLNLSKGIAKSTLLIISTVFIIIGAAGPAWNPHPKKLNRQGRDIVFILDVSKSMLADDLLPSRLQNSKQAIIDCLETLKNDRVGLVLFAGSSSIKCPLTNDYKFFRMMLDNADWSSVDTGGTRIGDAILKTIEKVFHAGSKGTQDIILITDGDDQDKHSIDAMKELDEKGINLLAIGVGDSKIGSRITINEDGAKRFLMAENAEVWTKMNSKKLQKLVGSTTDGIFLNVQTKSYALGKIYKRIVEYKKTKLVADSDITVFTEKYQYFIAIAVFLLFIRLGLSTKMKRPLVLSVALFTLLLMGNNLFANEAKIVDENVESDFSGASTDVYNRGCDAYSMGHYSKAISFFENVTHETKSKSLKIKSYYNLGNSQYMQANEMYVTSTAEAVIMIQQCIENYKVVKSLNPKNKKVAFNIEVARVLELAILKKNEDDNNADNPLQKMAKEAMESLQKLINRQETLRDSSVSSGTGLVSDSSKTDSQQKLQVNTKEFIKDLENIDELMPKMPESVREALTDDAGPPPGADGMKPLIKFVDNAILEQLKAIELIKLDKLASREQTKAVLELTSCLDALKEIFPDQNNEQKENESDKSKDGDYEESDDYEESNSDEENMDSSGSKGEFESNLESQDIPPPTDDPMDIIVEEVENNSLRTKNKPTKSSNVKKDW